MLTKGERLLQDNTFVHNSHIGQIEEQSFHCPVAATSFLSCLILLTLHHLIYLFPSMKGKCFQDDEALISEVTLWLRT